MTEIFLYGLLLLLIIYLIVLHKEHFLLGFVIVTLLSFPSELGSGIRSLIHITDFLIMGYLFIGRYGFDFQKYPRIPRLLSIFFTVFYAGMIISSLFSSYTMEGFSIIIQTTLFFLFVYAIYGIVTTQEQIRIIMLSLMISGVILTTSIIGEFFAFGGNVANPIRFRNFGFYSNINTSGLYVIVLYPLTVATFFLESFRKYRILSIILISFLSISVVLISSRVTFFGVILGSAIVFFFLNKKAFKIFSALFVSLALVHIILNPFGPAIDIALRLEEGLSQHDHFWQLAINMIKANPVFGIGPGAYSYEEFKYLPVMLNSYSGQVMVYINQVTFGSNNSHNFYLSFISDMGILGAIASVLLPVIFFRIVYLVKRKSVKVAKETNVITISIIAVGVCLFIRSFGESIGLITYGALSMDLPFWLLFLILISYHQNRITFPEEQRGQLIS